MTPAIRVENLGKCYRVNHAEERLPYKTLRDTLSRIATAPVRRWKSGGHGGVVEQFMALKDVSFDVQPGEVVGIIGRNGAGKSTLLKILSRITKPSTGRVTIDGRVGSLLEVGTGFHPELTGRENVYMNGSVLGMSRREITSKFDEIVDFSGVEKFLDTPVKRYSSGMQVRLAFAVAAHLEPEILVIDEVLAVGDAEFQKKCLGKMRDVASGGRTILFVSHNMAAVENLCSTGILLSEGRLVELGATRDVVTSYLSVAKDANCHQMRRTPGMIEIIQRISIHEVASKRSGTVRCGNDLRIDVHYQGAKPFPQARVGLRIDSMSGTPLVHLQSEIATGQLMDLPASGTVSCTIRRLALLPSRYSLVVAFFSKGAMLDCVNPAMDFDVNEGDFFGTGRLPDASLTMFLVRSEWQVNARR